MSVFSASQVFRSSVREDVVGHITPRTTLSFLTANMLGRGLQSIGCALRNGFLF